MLYIHELHHLTPKNAELESVYLMREIRQKNPRPFLEKKMEQHFAEFFVSETDIGVMEQALGLIEPTLEKVERINQERDPLYEIINVQRTIKLLKGWPEPLQNNLKFSREIAEGQKGWAAKITPLLNRIPRLRTLGEKIGANQELNEIFQKILRHPELRFNFGDIIGEGQISEVRGLSESLGKGFFFHFSLEEETKKVGFEEIKQRLPLEKLEEVEKIEGDIGLIRKGLERAYELNMRMVQWAVWLYSYVKVASSTY